MPNLAQISQGREVPLSAGIFEAVQAAVPALSHFDARPSTDTKFMTLARTALPSASGFKNLNEGFGNGEASLEVRSFDAKLLGAAVEIEQISANRWDAAHKGAGRSWRQIQVESRLEAELRHLNKVLFYGTVLDAKAFPGLKEMTPYSSGNSLSLTADPGADDFTKSFVNAGGTTSGTASSVYSVVYGEMNAQLVVCNDSGGELFTVTEPVLQHIAPDSNDPTKKLLCEIFQIYGFFGLSVCGMNETPGSVVPVQYAVRRLGNLTEDSGKGVTDAKLEQLVLSHGNGVTPSVLFMNGRSARQWADSRSASTATLFLGMSGDAKNNTGSLRAARPTHFEGIPVVYDSAILSTDAIEA